MKEQWGGPSGKWESEHTGIAEMSTGWWHVHFWLEIRFKGRRSPRYCSPATFSLEGRIVGISQAVALPGEHNRGREEQGDFHK